MSILGWIVLGLIAGWVASMIMGAGGYGVIGDIAVGIVGAIVGGIIFSMLLGIDVTGLDFTSLLISIIGAIIVIAVYRAVVPPGRRTL